MNKYLQLKPEHLDHFRYLDFYGKLDLLSRPDAFAIGATVENSETKTDEPAGLLVAKTEEDRISVEWLYVDEAYRGRGIGGFLLSLMFRESLARGFDSLAVRVSEMYVNNGLPWNPKGFFKECLFVKEEPEMPEWDFSATMLYDKKDAFLHTKKKCVLRPLSDVPEKTLDHMFQKVKEDGNAPYDIDACKSMADPELSYALYENKEPKGIVLVQRTENNIYPFCFDAQEKRAADFVADAFEMSEECVRPADWIHIAPTRPSVVNMFKQLEFSIPNWKVVNLVAKVSDFSFDD